LPTPGKFRALNGPVAHAVGYKGIVGKRLPPSSSADPRICTPALSHCVESGPRLRSPGPDGGNRPTTLRKGTNSMKSIPLLILLVAAIPCAKAGDHEKYCAELAQTERTFCAQVASIGLDDAFLANMADECFIPYRLSLTRPEYDSQVKAARAKAAASYKPGPDPTFQLVWTPSKVDVSQDGTLGYTWGRYDLTTYGKDGKAAVNTGIYLTVWKRDSDGAWKIAFDGGPELPTNAAAVKSFLARSDLPKPPKT